MVCLHVILFHLLVETIRIICFQRLRHESCDHNIDIHMLKGTWILSYFVTIQLPSDEVWVNHHILVHWSKLDYYVQEQWLD